MLNLKLILFLFFLHQSSGHHMAPGPNLDKHKGTVKKNSLSLEDIFERNKRNTCRDRNSCTISERCIFNNDCEGLPDLTCSNASCVPCHTVEMCNIGQGCTSNSHCMHGKSYRCSKNKCVSCATVSLCNVGEACSSDNECGGAEGLVCSSKKCTACKSVKACKIGDACSTDDECGGARSLICSSNLCKACRTEKLCKIGDYCSNHADCGGAPDLVCSSNSCTGGSWSAFNSWSSCNAYCGEGIRTRTRTCTGSGPKPICHGKAVESEKCSNLTCLECYEFEIDYQGSDVAQTLTNTVEECKLDCQDHESCTHFTWNSASNTCLLKYSSSERSSYSSAVSGPKVCDGHCLHYNKNSPGTIWTEKHFDTPEECQFDCYTNRMICSHFTFYTRSHSNQSYHRMCRQFSSIHPFSIFSESGCIFGPNIC